MELFTVLATGHNLDDEISRLFSNILRWDVTYLSDQGPYLPASGGFAAKVKPLFRLSEFETANYAFKRYKLALGSTCPYSPGATFTYYKTLWGARQKCQAVSSIFYLGFLKQGRPAFTRQEELDGVEIKPCTLCSYPTSGGVCGVCRIREAINSPD